MDPEDVFDLFKEEFNEDSPVDPTWASFDKGRVLGSRILRKVSELVDTYKGMDVIKDEDNRDRAKNRTLDIYNKLLYSYIAKIPPSNIHVIRGIAHEDTGPVADITTTLIKYYERNGDFNSCALLQTFREELLYQDLIKYLWKENYI